MNATEIVAELSSMGVSVVCPSRGRIRLTVEVGDVPPEAVALARDHKPALIDHLTLDCRLHNNPAIYSDVPAPNRPGWTRSSGMRSGNRMPR